MLKFNYCKFVRISILITVSIIISSCGIFEPRDNEEPEQPAPWVSNPVNAEQILTNLQYSYNYSQNATNYNAIFTSDYTFHFSNQDILEHGTPETMNKLEEMDMLINLHKNLSGSNDEVVLSFYEIDSESDQINSDTAVLYRSYEIQVTSNGQTTTYSGKAEFHLISTGRWFISQWYDFRSDSNKTWGKLKYEYAL